MALDGCSTKKGHFIMAAKNKIEVKVSILVDPVQIKDEPVKVLVEIKDQSDAGFLE